MPLTSSHLIASLQSFLAHHPGDAARLQQLVEFAQSSDSPFSRATLPGHITASAFLVNPADQTVLLIHHQFLNKLLQPGGHTEAGDDSLLAAALRELAEETGITPASLQACDAARPPLVDIDIHSIPANPAKGEPGHMHFDFRYAFLLKENTEALVTLQLEEVASFRWLPWASEDFCKAIGPRPQALLGAWLLP